MKVTSEENKFQPIVLTITIESEEELCDLWHRTGCSSYIINDSAGDLLKFPAEPDLASNLFWKLNELVEKHNLKKS